MLIPRPLIVAFASLAAICCAVAAADTPIAGDAEAAKHGFEAADVRVVAEEDLPGFVFRQFDLAVLSHYSYLIGSAGEALVVDPARDVDVYIKTAKDLGLKITGIYLTHSHADFVAGHTELAKLTGAPIYINKLSEAGYDHQPLTDNYEIKVGGIRCVVRLTPGHTPDGTCLFVHHPANAPDPRLCLTGDTLFIGSVGRPDLMGGSWTAAQLAEMIFNTWQNVLSRAPDATQIYPAHGAGSLCGANLSDANVSTFGEQKQTNPYTKYKDLATFTMAVLDGLPEAPQYFGKNAAMNRAGPPPVDWSAQMPAGLSPSDVAQKAAVGACIIDVREAAEFAQGHVPGSLSIPIRGRFETWTGIMVPWGTPFVLVGSDKQVKEATFRMHRVGYDSPAGYLKGSVASWQTAGKPLRTVTLVKARELHRQIQEGKAPILVDVRLPKEWMALRIARQLLNMPINELHKDAAKLNPKMPVMTICNSAYRSSMGASVLLKGGFEDVCNLEGGSKAWIEAGLPTYSAKPEAGGESAEVLFLDLPEPVGPQDLARRLMDLPGSLQVVDIRPSWQFEEYHISGAANTTPSDVLGNAAYLVGRTPLVIVCRDGALSAAIGGTLSPKTERSIRYVSGGMIRYWEEVMRPSGVISDKASAPMMPPRTGVPTLPATPPTVPAPARPVKKRVSAGC
jgi:hydroxyacylglutathione hydrolase